MPTAQIALNFHCRAGAHGHDGQPAGGRLRAPVPVRWGWAAWLAGWQHLLLLEPCSAVCHRTALSMPPTTLPRRSCVPQLGAAGVPRAERGRRARGQPRAAAGGGRAARAAGERGRWQGQLAALVLPLLPAAAQGGFAWFPLRKPAQRPGLFPAAPPTPSRCSSSTALRRWRRRGTPPCSSASSRRAPACFLSSRLPAAGGIVLLPCALALSCSRPASDRTSGPCSPGWPPCRR